MIRRLLLLLFGAAAVSGGLYVFRSVKSRGVAKIKDGWQHRRDSPTLERPKRMRRRMAAALVIGALVLGVAAYPGLAGGSHASAITPSGPSLDANISLGDDSLSQGDVNEMSADTGLAPARIAPPWEADIQPAKQIVRAADNALVQPPTDGFEAIICAKAWPCAEAISVASCESGLDRHGRLDGNWARNGHNYGLFQINSVHADKWPDFYQDWMDPLKNTDWAFEIWSKSGWGPWECQPGRGSSQKVANYTGDPSTSDSTADEPAAIDPNDTPVPEPTDTPAPDSPTQRPTRSAPTPTPALPNPVPTR